MFIDNIHFLKRSKVEGKGREVSIPIFVRTRLFVFKIFLDIINLQLDHYYNTNALQR